MKGPYERLRYNLQRVWECPICHHRERTSGSETFCLCPCQAALPPTQCVWMRLEEDGIRRAAGSVDRLARPEAAAEERQDRPSDGGQISGLI
jgi:hypothetical protein